MVEEGVAQAAPFSFEEVLTDAGAILNCMYSVFLEGFIPA